MEDNLVSIANGANKVSQSLKNATQVIKETAQNTDEALDNVDNTTKTRLFKLLGKCAMLSSGFIVGVFVTCGAIFWKNNSGEFFEKTKVSIQENIENKYFLMMLEEEFGLYKAELIVKSLKKKHSGQELEEESYESRTLHYFEEAILNNNNYYYQDKESKSNTTNITSDISSDRNVSEASQKIYDTVVVEFASNKVLPQNTAAACHQGAFFNKKVELKNISNLENNAFVSVDNPIDCNARPKKSACENHIDKDNNIIQIPFAVAEKLYPELINTKNNHNILKSCDFALAEIVVE